MARKRTRISTTVFALVTNRNRHVLMVRREFEPSAGKLTLPGMDSVAGHWMSDTVLHELRAQTGLVGDAPIVRAVIDSMNKSHRTIYLIYQVRVADQTTLRPGEGIASVEWVDTTQCDSDAVAFNLYQPIVNVVHR
jgi:ADP-ribose pyrophosphatase YjhB (NUDIX family)